MESAALFKEAVLSEDLSLMDEMLENMKANGHVPVELDDFTIRKMVIKRDKLKQDIERFKNLKRAVLEEWDRQIKKREEDIKILEDLIYHYIKTKNGGQALKLDVGTISTRRVSHSVKVMDKEKVKAYFEGIGRLNEVVKEPQLDETLVKQFFLNNFESVIQEEVEARIRQEELETGKKVTKKREKEIREEIIQRAAENFKLLLPEGVEYVEPTETLSIRMNF